MARLPATALKVPIVGQANYHTCGAACLLAVLQYWQAGLDNDWSYLTEPDLYDRLKVTPDGIAPKDIARVAREFGLEAEFRANIPFFLLRALVEDGSTAIVSVQAWPDDRRANWLESWEDGHYAVVVAIDMDNVYVMDPSTRGRYAYVPVDEFLARWHDYEGPDRETGAIWQGAIIISGRQPIDCEDLQPME